jgi:hypothetical protein
VKILAGIAVKILAGFAMIICCLAMTGCIGGPANPASARSVTDVPEDHAQPWYWLDQPVVASATSTDFDKLWAACDKTVRDYQFEIDRSDLRLGLLTSKPLVSKQVFEFWRRDVGSFAQTMDSTMQTMRRTIRFEVVRSQDGTFEAQPRVLVEKFALPERRVTTVSEFRDVLVPVGKVATVQTATGQTLPNEYWYSVGRDTALERELAKSVQDRLR